jgi:hypothetical protein
MNANRPFLSKPRQSALTSGQPAFGTRFASFRMRNNRHDKVRIVLDQKIEAPVAVHARLPEAGGLVVLLGVQRGVVEVRRRQPNLLLEGLLNRERRAAVVPL